MTLRPDRLDTALHTSCSDPRRLDEAAGDGAAAPATEATDEVEKRGSSGSRVRRSQQSADTRTAFLLTQSDREWISTTAGPGFESPNSVGELSQTSTLRPTQAGVAPSRQYSPDQSALIGLAKEHRVRGVTCAESAALKQWASEVGLAVRGPEVHPSRPVGRSPHLHVGPVDHIPVNDYG